MDAAQTEKSFTTIRLIAKHLMPMKFPNLRRPIVGATSPATRELVDWGTQVYCFAWIRHFGTLINGIVILKDAKNTPSARIVARSVFELGAHAYYVKKHLKQHLKGNDLKSAWEFLTPVAIGSRYMNEQVREENEIFPAPAHINKAIKCFGEVMPEDSREGYSYLSEFCHPTTFTFLQYYEWLNPYEIQFVHNEEDVGVFGSTAAASILGLMAIDDILLLANERGVLKSVRKLLAALTKLARMNPSV